MKHETAAELLNDYLDGELDAPLAEELEGHVHRCVTCRRELAGLRQLLATAATLPRSIEPDRDFWPAIAEETMPHDKAPGNAGSRLLQHLGFFSWSWPTALATTAVVGVLLLSSFDNESLPGPGNNVSPAGTTIPADTEPQGAALVQSMEAECLEYGRELDAYSGEAPENSRVAQMLKENMPVVDRAISEARAAWLASPNEPGLARFLTSAYKAKMALQGRAIRMASES